MVEHNERRTDKWTLDKHVNIPILVALMMNFSALVWGASKLDSRVEYLENNLIAEQMKNQQVGDRLRLVEVGMARVESKLDTLIVRKHDE
jgi:hypothetical protein